MGWVQRHNRPVVEEDGLRRVYRRRGGHGRRDPRQVLTREVIFDRVWGYDFGGESNIIEVYVRYLRQKTETAGETRLVHTVRGVGYVLREE